MSYSPKKHYKGIWEIWPQWNIFFFNLEVHAIRYPRGYENEGLARVCESELETPLPALEMSLAPN